MYELQCGVEPNLLVSAVIEMPKVVMHTPQVLSLIMVRDCIQQSSVLTAVSKSNSHHMWVRAHDDPGVLCQNAPPPIVSNNAGDKVSPTVEIES